MPGAELDALYLFATSGEVFKLLARFFAYVNALPGACTVRRAGETLSFEELGLRILPGFPEGRTVFRLAGPGNGS